MTKREAIEMLDRFAANRVRVSFRNTFTLPGGRKIAIDEGDGELPGNIVDEIITALVDDAGYPLEIANAAFAPSEDDPPIVKHLTEVLRNTSNKISVEDAERLIADYTGTTYERFMVNGKPVRRLKNYIKEIVDNELTRHGIKGNEAKEIKRKMMKLVTNGVVLNKQPFSFIGVSSERLFPNAKRGTWVFFDSDRSRDELNKWTQYHLNKILKEREWESDGELDIVDAIFQVCSRLGIRPNEAMALDDDGVLDFKQTIINMAKLS